MGENPAQSLLLGALLNDRALTAIIKHHLVHCAGTFNHFQCHIVLGS
jgi:hypothetical protein